MKSLIATGLVLCAGIVGSLAPVTSAYALPINHAGQICHDISNSSIVDFGYSISGIQAVGFNFDSVICPLVVQKDVRGGLTVDVSVDRTGPYAGRTNCALYGFDYTGKFLGFDAGRIDPPADFVRLKLYGNQTAFFGYYSVACNLPYLQTLTTITVLD